MKKDIVRMNLIRFAVLHQIVEMELLKVMNNVMTVIGIILIFVQMIVYCKDLVLYVVMVLKMYGNNVMMEITSMEMDVVLIARKNVIGGII